LEDKTTKSGGKEMVAVAEISFQSDGKKRKLELNIDILRYKYKFK